MLIIVKILFGKDMSIEAIDQTKSRKFIQNN